MNKAFGMLYLTNSREESNHKKIQRLQRTKNLIETVCIYQRSLSTVILSYDNCIGAEANIFAMGVYY
jgi:hypothetical protein